MHGNGGFPTQSRLGDPVLDGDYANRALCQKGDYAKMDDSYEKGMAFECHALGNRFMPPTAALRFTPRAG